MYGPVSGNRHDSFLLSNSGLLNKLQEFMPDDAPEHEQIHQQDFCICQKYEWTGDKLGHHIVNILQLQHPQVHDQMEIGMDDNTIQLGKRLLIHDLSKGDALTHFHFCKVHLQEVADKLWPRLQCFLRGHRGSIKVNNGTYSLQTFQILYHWSQTMMTVYCHYCCYYCY